MGMSLLPVIYIIYFTIECYKPTPLSWSRVGGVPSRQSAQPEDEPRLGWDDTNIPWDLLTAL